MNKQDQHAIHMPHYPTSHRMQTATIPSLILTITTHQIDE